MEIHVDNNHRLQNGAGQPGLKTEVSKSFVYISSAFQSSQRFDSISLAQIFMDKGPQKQFSFRQSAMCCVSVCAHMLAHVRTHIYLLCARK